jgi:hypothetical protein
MRLFSFDEGIYRGELAQDRGEIMINAYFPRRDIPSSQARFQDIQLRHGCISSTLHRTRRALQARQAFFARVRGLSGSMLLAIIIQIGCLLFE